MAERFQIIPQEERVRQILKERKAVLAGDHFQYASGKHGSEYVNKSAIFPDGESTAELCKFLVRPFQAKNIDTVAGPQMGGVILSYESAKALTQMEYRPIHGVFAEKVKEKDENGKEVERLRFTRGYEEYIKGKNVLAVEDILNTGGSALELINEIRKTGGNVVGLAAIVNRGGVKSEAVGNVPIYSLLNVNMESWTPEDCRLCKDGMPLNTTVGHAKK